MGRIDLQKLNVAITYVERIAEGCNPVNNVALEDNDVLNNPNVIRCMYFIKEVLEEVRNNDGIINGKKEKAELLPFPVEALEEFQYREDQSISHVVNQIHEPVVGFNVKKISVVKVTTILKEEGYLLEEKNPITGKMSKVPSERGKELGIYVVEREFNGRTYQAVMYNRKAQEYVVKVVRKLVEIS